MVENIELTELDSSDELGSVLFDKNDLALCGHVKATVEVLLAKVDITLEQLLALKKGSIVETQQSLDAPMVMVLNGKPIASGRLVVSNDHFAFEVLGVKESHL